MGGWMTGIETKIQVQEEARALSSLNMSLVLDLAEKLDFLDIQILRKFYVTGKEFPHDTQPFCFPILFREMKNSHHLKIGIEALRKRLNNFVEMNLLEKIKSSNPTSYMPVTGREELVRAVVTKFFLIHGLTKFL
jgi:hypothetical protein